MRPGMQSHTNPLSICGIEAGNVGLSVGRLTAYRSVNQLLVVDYFELQQDYSSFNNMI